MSTSTQINETELNGNTCINNEWTIDEHDDGNISTNGDNIFNENELEDVNSSNYNNINNLQDDINFLKDFRQLDYDYTKSQNEQIIEREKLFNNFLKEYTQTFKEKSKQKKILKNIFFGCIMIVLIGVPTVSFVFIAKADNTIELIATVLSSLGEFITAFIILPKIIAKYLFDKEEDKNLTNLIIKMQDYNLSSKHKGKKDENNDIENNNN